MKTFYFVLKPPVINPQDSLKFNEIIKDHVQEHLSKGSLTVYDSKKTAKKTGKIPFILVSIEMENNIIVRDEEIKSNFSSFKYEWVYSDNNSNKETNNEKDDIELELSEFYIIGNNKKTEFKKKTPHFYLVIAIATKKLFHFFSGNVEENFHDILGSFIFKAFEKKADTHPKPVAEQNRKCDTAYLTCSLNDESSDGGSLTEVDIKKISIDKIDFSIMEKKKIRHLRFKNDRYSPSLFFKESSSGNFSPSFSEDRYIISNNNNNNSSRKKPHGSIILNKANIKPASDQNEIKEYIINYVTKLNHTDVLKILNPFNNQQEPLIINNELEKNTEIDVKQRIVVELFLSNNDMIDEKLREDFSIEKIKVTYSKDFEIKEFAIFEKEIYSTLEITEYNMSLQRY